ncbi:OSM1 [Candida jiufengensis]|uniref:OSM1 n=1 Tax=Candida jiufengensis TaxID=497108 RepID=UPI0022243F6E|nr:OSM1 [Candida jiufengensis]KAI5951900.1 OSM1 [Candida jiufengensis]
MTETNQSIVVGSGLAGLTTTFQLINNGSRVILLEKTDKLGGNSVKASSGINGVPTIYQHNNGDTIEFFQQDTIKSGKGLSNTDLVSTLTSKSLSAIEWLTKDIGVDLSKVTLLGGHSFPRTHRGSGPLPPGFAIVSSLIKKIEDIQTKKPDTITILKQSKLNKIISDEKNNKVNGVEYIDEVTNETKQISCKNLVLATGGYSADTQSLDTSLISKHRPDLLQFASSNGQQTTGDGVKIAERDLDVKLIHMNKIQVHPTGFLNINDLNSKWKFLCGELLRGIGGVLLSPHNGERFINELETRDVVTDSVLKHCNVSCDSNGLAMEKDTYISVLVISEEDYAKANSHIDFYVYQKLLQKGTFEQLYDLLKKINPNLDLSYKELIEKFTYIDELVSGSKTDSLGRKSFGNKFSNKPIYFGLTTPVLHYSMGGIEIDKNSRAIKKNGEIFENLYAVGEVSGGLHGENRLGGNSLLECVVFGREVSNHILN